MSTESTYRAETMSFFEVATDWVMAVQRNERGPGRLIITLLGGPGWSQLLPYLT